MKATVTVVQWFYQHELVARLREPDARAIVRNHPRPAAHTGPEHDPQWCLAQANKIGPACHARILALLNVRCSSTCAVRRESSGFAARWVMPGWKPHANGNWPMPVPGNERSRRFWTKILRASPARSPANAYRYLHQWRPLRSRSPIPASTKRP